MINKYLKVFLTMSFSLLIIYGCGSDEDAEKASRVEAPAFTEIKKLKIPENGKQYFGAFADFGNSEDQVSKQKIRDFESLAGKKLAWAYASNNWKNGIKYPREIIKEINASGTTPFIRLIPRIDNGENESSADPLYTMQNFINGKFDSQLREWAKDSKVDNIPLLIDFGLEMTGFWFPWSGTYCGGGKTDGYGDPNYPDGPERFRDAYRHIIDIFRDEGANHITWFFHPDIQRWPDEEWNSAKYYYPGDDYIDWIGLSIYGVQFADEDWVLFSDQVKRYEKLINEITTAYKPIAILEFGVTDGRDDGTKKEWLEDAFATIKDNPYLKFSAITYWHENWINADGSTSSIRIDSSKQSLETFRKHVADDDFISKSVFGLSSQ